MRCLISRLLLQGRSISAIVLSVLHVLAYYVGDAIIMAEVRLTAPEIWLCPVCNVASAIVPVFIR